MSFIDFVKIIALAIVTYLLYNKGKDIYLAYYESKFRVKRKKYQKVKGVANVSKEKYETTRIEYLQALDEYHAYINQRDNKS